VRSTRLAHLNLFDLITLIVFGKEYEVLKLKIPQWNIKVKKPAAIFLRIGLTYLIFAYCYEMENFLCVFRI
jgi:hypothetical protein